jgi:hypothetical protein
MNIASAEAVGSRHIGEAHQRVHQGKLGRKPMEQREQNSRRPQQ